MSDRYDEKAEEVLRRLSGDWSTPYIVPEIAKALRESVAEALDSVAKRAEGLNQECAGRPGGWIAAAIRDDVKRWADSIRKEVA